MKVKNPKPEARWHQGQIVEIEIGDLSDSGEGVGRWEGGVVFVPDTVPGDRLLVKLIRVKPQYATGKVEKLLEPSKQRIRPQCFVADKCGGCQWQQVEYEYQLEAKQNKIVQALQRIAGLDPASVAPILPSPSPFGYRNKVTYPLGLSGKGQVQAGYYQKSSHRLINLNKCPVQDERLNPLLEFVKQDIQQRRWSIYNEGQDRGILRHLSLRIGRRTGEILLTLIANSSRKNRKREIPGLETQARQWLDRYPELVGIGINYNSSTSNVIFGPETDCVAGRSYLQEVFGGLQFQLRADTFFQVNTEAAEALLETMVEELNLQGSEIIVDAYCGIGTFSLPLAKKLQELGHRSPTEVQIIGLEAQPQAIELAQSNASLNNLTNASFHTGKVEKLLPELEVKPDIVLLDPPRKGCAPQVLETLRSLQPNCIVYISCKPATLARDLQFLCEGGDYELTKVQPADFFPQTSHVECVAFLRRKA
ncbi:MAG: 23S rRNA (uracil(1939)-C(5))-methyltransferase RlmD [Cyanobacteriota bacterium]|nr:23S rRNA (uracil(1939)-C(5))-methyltransferase RlmD [Cyanobacteriota bacterium]